MNKTISYLAIVVFLFVGDSCKTQELLNLYSPTYLYKTPHIRGEKLGVFTVNGMFTKIEETDFNWWKVEAENNRIGYIQAAHARNKLSDTSVQFPDFEKQTTTNGEVLSFRVYTQIDKLEGRSSPYSDAEVIHTFKINTPLEVSFLPYKEEAWVNVGAAFKGKRIYVPRKYLGSRLKVDSLITLYSELNRNDIEVRKYEADKILEVGKNKEESYENSIKALNVYLELHKELNNPAEIKETEGKLKILNYLQNSKLNKNKQGYLAGNYLELKGKVISSDEITFKTITYIKLPYKKSIKNISGCREYIDSQYIYDSFVLYMKSGINKGYVYKVDLSKTGNAFVISDFRIDKNTTEKDFIEQVDSHFYTDWVNKPHQYIFYIGESGYITLTFENGKPKWYQVDYYC